MRLGWLIPPPRLHTGLVTAKHASDLGSPALPQLVLAQLIASGELDRHVRQVRGRQRGRRDALLAVLRDHLPGARVQGVPAGLHLLITFPGLDGRGADDAELAAPAAARRRAGPPAVLAPGEPGQRPARPGPRLCRALTRSAKGGGPADHPRRPHLGALTPKN